MWIEAKIEKPIQGKPVVCWTSRGNKVIGFFHEGFWWTEERFPRSISVTHWREVIKAPRTWKSTQALALAKVVGINGFDTDIITRLGSLGFHWSDTGQHWYFKEVVE